MTLALRSSQDFNTSVNNHGSAVPGSSQIAEAMASNPFLDPPGNRSNSTRFVDVSSVRSSKSPYHEVDDDDENPFGDDDQYWARGSFGTSDAELAESEMYQPVVHSESDLATSTTMTIDCPYPVMELDTPTQNGGQQSHLSMKSGISYATLESDWEKKREGLLSRNSSITSYNSGPVNVSLFLLFFNWALQDTDAVRFTDGICNLNGLRAGRFSVLDRWTFYTM
jgi:hypothetical protein